MFQRKRFLLFLREPISCTSRRIKMFLNLNTSCKMSPEIREKKKNLKKISMSKSAMPKGFCLKLLGLSPAPWVPAAAACSGRPGPGCGCRCPCYLGGPWAGGFRFTSSSHDACGSKTPHGGEMNLHTYFLFFLGGGGGMRSHHPHGRRKSSRVAVVAGMAGVARLGPLAPLSPAQVASWALRGPRWRPQRPGCP